jgi:dipeptidase D
MSRIKNKRGVIMTEALRGLQPHDLWQLFEQIASIPHGSNNEEALAGHLSRIAEGAGLTVKQDDAGNISIAVPATPGCERTPVVVLQGHLDMVCEKNTAVDFDFSQEAIRLVRDGDWLKADGTSLGADNGIGVAAALAIALSQDMVHGPLEVLLTVNEETGLIGALELSPDLVSGHIMLNLDSERTGSICIGCAGGGGVTTHLPLTLHDTPDGTEGLELRLTGLRGGHSGLDIIENRGNAVKLMARTVLALHACGATLADFHSGDKLNAIPREGFAHLVLPVEQLARTHEIIAHQLKLFRTEFPHEPTVQITTTRISPSRQVLSTGSLRTALNMLMAFPNGVLAMSREMQGLVETSNNLSSAHMKGGGFVVHNTPRSSRAEALQATVDQIVAVADLAGGTNELEEPYPGWQPNPHSKILHIVEDTYTDVFGKRPQRVATHAGLECGAIAGKCAGMDMVSFGPDIVNAHSPDEAVRISSVKTFWQLLVGILQKVAKGAYQEAS